MTKKAQKPAVKFDRYTHYAAEAAKQERKGNYADAAFKWEIAELSAQGANCEWASNRRAFCERMDKRPF